ncbi:hypothetical protein C8F01DRAFT_1229647 [Mycena amicta]|nr:hypothetical protein C8F01DRAFT_1229647 [Mycena amicta]
MHFPLALACFLATIATLAMASDPVHILSKRSTYSFTISDFQGHQIDLHNGGRDNFTPVHSFATTQTKNQQWAIIYSMDARELYVLSNMASGTQMTHTTALLPGADVVYAPGPAMHAQIVGGSDGPFWWKLSSHNGSEAGIPAGTRFIDNDSGLALTAWTAKRGYSSSPMTLETADPTNAQQAFRLTCVENLSLGGKC